MDAGMDGGPGMGGMPGMGGLGGLFNDPEMMAGESYVNQLAKVCLYSIILSVSAFADPEVAAAFKDISSNPANIMKYQNNPKVMNLVTKMAGKMGGGGPGGGAGGGMPGMGGLGGD